MYRYQYDENRPLNELLFSEEHYGNGRAIKIVDSVSF